MSTELFRKQAVDAQNRFVIGSVRLQKMPYQSLVVVSVAILCAAVLLFVSFATYTNKATVQGVLQTQKGVSRVQAEIEGTIKALYVEEGQRVRAGQSLVLIEPQVSSSDQVNINVELTGALEEQKRLTLEESTTLEEKREALLGAHAMKRRSVEKELEKLGTELEINSKQINVQQSTKAKLETLLAKNFVSPLDIQAAEKELLDLQLARSGLERQVIHFEQSLLDAQQALELRVNEISVQLLSLQRQLSNLERQDLQHQSTRGRLITSPADGYVTNLLVHDSQLTSAKSELLTIAPADDKLLANLYIPTRSSGLIKQQQTVNLRINAFPYQKYGTFAGRISSISRTPLHSTGSSSAGDSVYLARVDLVHQGVRDGPLEYSLRPGMQLEADVLLDKRRVLDMVFDPILRVVRKI